jgi:hypothetical protein
MVDSAVVSVNSFKWAICPVLILAICLGTAGSAHGWSNGGYSSDENNPDYGTHDWIANAALHPQTKDITFLETTYHALFLLGTEAPDNPSYIGDTGSHHVYYYSDETIQDDVCADRAASIYASALQYVKSNDLNLAAFEVGVMAHYISDVGVFGHTMGASTNWGAEVHHSDYENGFESMLGSIPIPSTSLGNLGAYDATTGLAHKITFGSGTIKSNTWMDTNYNWMDSVFDASAISSLYASVTAVAAAINHLMIEADQPGELTATGSVSVSNGTRPLSISFTCSPSGGVPPYTYSWTFGDGETSTQQNPLHIYSSKGTYEAIVTVTDSALEKKQWIKIITVTEPATVNEPAGAGGLDTFTISSLVIAIVSLNGILIYVIRRRRREG